MPRNEPLVSVVICTYKRPRLVVRAIASVQRQTYRNLEILVIDDGSVDETGMVVKRIEDERIRYIQHRKNQGLPRARNTGIEAAAGQYIAFLDDDDEWHETKLQKQLSLCGRHDAMLTGALLNGTRLKLYKKDSVTLTCLKRGNFFDPSSLLAKSFVFDHLRFDENLRHGEDWDIFIRIAQEFSIGYVNEPLLLYNDGAHLRMTNEAENLSMGELEKRMAILQKHKNFFGQYWFDYHRARIILSYWRRRADKPEQIRCAFTSCRALPVFAALMDKAIAQAYGIAGREW